MEDRAYLSIGEVLSLLKDEFPDVTISKIRFLESQGLLDPERTPSGYRKFYETDVDRLRWILRQQREHFLPLKVIKGRLRGGDDALSDDVLDPEDGCGRGSPSGPQPAAGAGRFGPGRAGDGGDRPAGGSGGERRRLGHRAWRRRTPTPPPSTPVLHLGPPGALRAAAAVVEPGG